MQNKAVKLSAAAVVLFFLVLLTGMVLAPRVAHLYGAWRALPQSAIRVLIAAFYGCVVPAMIAMVCLFLLLRNIRLERPFLEENSRLMAIISWCCAAVAVVTLVSCFWYMPLLFVSAPMAFIFLIVRVVRNCFIAAIQLKEENRLTI